jgi:protein NrfC
MKCPGGGRDASSSQQQQMAREVSFMAANKKAGKKKFSRRDFVVGGGTVLAGGALTTIAPVETLAATAAKTAEKSKYALSTGYLVYDSRRCAGCLSCMLACSLVHDGATSTSLSRIQVSRAVLTKYPHDIQIFTCRQCPEPMCVENCPTGACHVSAANGNVRMIDSKKCSGCGTCLKACPHTPHRTIFNLAANKATKCDLCADAPYFDKKGGPSGDQACVIACPVRALKLVAELPSQIDNSGYDVDLPPPPTPAPSGPGAKPATAPPATAAPAKG